MKKVGLFSITQKNGLIIFCEPEKKLFCDDIEGYVINGFQYDDTYTSQEIIDEVSRSGLSIIVVQCSFGTLRFASRMLQSFNKAYKNDLKLVIITNEITDQTEINLYGMNIKVLNSFENIKKIFDEDIFVKTEMKFSELPVNKEEGCKLALMNGYMAYVTGMYPVFYGGYKYKHIGFDSFDEFIENSSQISLCVNSSCIIHESYTAEKYEKAMRIANAWSHFIFASSGGDIYIDDYKNKAHFPICSMNTYAKNYRQSGNVTLIRLKTKMDYNIFEGILHAFFYEGRMLMPEYFLIDECRFLRTGCLAMRLQRGVIKKRNFFPCQNSGNSMGAAMEDVNKRYAKWMKNSGCTTKQCVLASNDENYKQLLKKFPDIYEYIIMRNIYCTLKRESITFQNANEIRVSNSRCTFFYKGMQGNGACRVDIFLFALDSQCYFFDIKKSRLIRLDCKIALVLEGYIKGAKEEDIIKDLSRYCNVSIDSAMEIFIQGEEMIRQSCLL